jgi:hypothetical protein
MIPKEKADELVNKYKSLIISAEGCNEGSKPCITSSNMFTKSAIDCALIAVDEMIDQMEDPNIPYSGFSLYWSIVKEELQKRRQTF